VQTGAEPTYCMGDDVPLPVLASTPHMLYDYFKQRFAQVGSGCYLNEALLCAAALGCHARMRRALVGSWGTCWCTFLRLWRCMLPIHEHVPL
jgi:hypothetical protein